MDERSRSSQSSVRSKVTYLKLLYSIYPAYSYFSEYKHALDITRKYCCRTILDVGCGAGNLFKLLMSDAHIERYVGIDLANIFRVKDPRASFINADARNPPDWILNQRFDCIFFINSLFYISTDALKIYRDTGRYIIVIDINPRPKYLHVFITNLLEGRIRKTLDELLRDVEKMGFRVVEMKDGVTYYLVLEKLEQKNNIINH